MPISREQLRLDADQLDELMHRTRSMHAATVSPDGWPHVVPLWFVWHAGTIWVNNLRRSRRSRDIASGSPVALCVDAGHEYAELRGAVFYGRLHDATGDEQLATARAAFARKYFGLADLPDITSHVWLRLEPERVVSWDFRKIPPGRDKRVQTVEEAGGRSAGA